MLMLKVILALFPESFAQRFGEEWTAVSEELLADAKRRGRGAWLWAWIRLCLDTAMQVPVSHGRAIGVAIVGQPPVLAGVSGMEGAWLLARHWGIRPALAVGRGLGRHLLALTSGHLFAVAVWWTLEQHAATTLSVTIIPGSVDPSPQKEIMLLVLGLLGLMVCAGWKNLNGRRGAVRLDRLASACLVFVLGFYLGSTALLLGQMRPLSREAIAPFVAWPALVDSPVAHLKSADPNLWTAEQREWFDPAQPQSEHLRPGKQPLWCAMKGAQVDTWRQQLLSDANSTSTVALLLWQSQLDRLRVHGCISEAQWVEQHDSMGLMWRQGPGLFLHTWEPLAGIHPVADALTQAHYIIWERTLLNPIKYCTTESLVMARRGYEVDQAAIVELCQKADGARGISSPGGDAGIKPWWMSRTRYLRERNQSIHPMTQAQRSTLKRVLLENRQRWEKKVTGG